jgi:Cu(I)/Ag(I) efflux system membrane protein CusA/SilA
VLTAILTTVVSFLPVFVMIGAEGKLFKPLAFTKTFALLASVIVALTIVPALAHTLFGFKITSRKLKITALGALILVGGVLAYYGFFLMGAVAIAIAIYHLTVEHIPAKLNRWLLISFNFVMVLVVGVILTRDWLPLGPGAGFIKNFLVVAFPIAGLLLFFWLFMKAYAPMLRIMLHHKAITMTIPVLILVMGGAVWLGFNTLFGWLPESFQNNRVYSSLSSTFPGLGKEFMPALDEGSYLYMPTTMPHASIGEVMDVLRMQDMAFAEIPEIKSAVGKLGRAETPLDPAPISMIETIINYYPEYLIDKDGKRLQFKFDFDQQESFKNAAGKEIMALDGKPYIVTGKFLRDSDDKLIPDRNGMPFRLWRPALDPQLNPGRKAWRGIRKPNDIWSEIIRVGEIPGATSAPKLQPIAARIVMLQSGMRAPMGVKIKGPDLPTIEKVGLQIEKYLKEVPSVEPAAVFADRIVGKPYLEIVIDRDAIARYGLRIQDVQDVIEVAIGGRQITTTVEGRERYPVRVRYYRELRDSIESLSKILVASSNGQQIPLSQLTKTKYVRGPQVIKSEDTALIGYVLLDKKPGYAEVDVVEQAQAYLQKKIDSGEFALPAGVSYSFAGNYENQLRAKKTMTVVLPVALFIIFMILYFQFKSIPTTSLVFSSIAIAWAGGFVLIWMYGQPWFMNFSLFGENMRDLFQVHEINLSIAIWVGFLALFGIASDNGVIISTYLDQSFATNDVSTIEKIRETTILGAERRIRPCLTTSATTILALLPILTSSGRGSDIMVPMAIPSFGGMLVVLVSAFIVPLLYCMLAELKFKYGKNS